MQEVRRSGSGSGCGIGQESRDRDRDPVNPRADARAMHRIGAPRYDHTRSDLCRCGVELLFTDGDGEFGGALDLQLDLDEGAVILDRADPTRDRIVRQRIRSAAVNSDEIGTYRDARAVAGAPCRIARAGHHRAGAHPQTEPVRRRRFQPSLQHVVPANEPGHEARGRRVEDRARRADLLDAPVVHDHHRVRDRHRFLLRVGHVDERDPEIALQSPELPAHAHPQEGVQGGQRLVEQEH